MTPTERSWWNCFGNREVCSTYPNICSDAGIFIIVLVVHPIWLTSHFATLQQNLKKNTFRKLFTFSYIPFHLVYFHIDGGTLTLFAFPVLYIPAYLRYKQPFDRLVNFSALKRPYLNTNQSTTEKYKYAIL